MLWAFKWDTGTCLQFHYSWGGGSAWGLHGTAMLLGSLGQQHGADPHQLTGGSSAD